MKVLLDPAAKKSLDRLVPKTRERVIKALRPLRDDPKAGKPLSPSRFRSVRVGEIRAIYEIQDDQVVVLFIGHRSKVYTRFQRFL